MARFIECSISYIEQGQNEAVHKIYNNPINMCLCKYFSRSQSRWGLSGTMFSIVFEFNDGRSCEWHFTDVKERDEEIERLMRILRYNK
jgi:hypothetical protein